MPEQARSARRLCWTSAFVAASLALNAASSSSGATSGAGLTIEPLVLLDAGQIAACGVRVVDAARRLDLRVQLRRTGSSAVVEVRAAGMPTSGGPPSDIEVQTVSVRGGDLFNAEAFRDATDVVRSAPAESASATVLLREFMVSGATFAVRGASGERREVVVDGPLSPSIRAAYLNCAGDLYRPQ